MMRNKERVNDASVDNEVDELEGIKEEKDDNGDGINRKNFLFSDTEKGAAASAAVMSIIETAKRNELDVYGYLLYLLTVLPKWGADPTETQLKSVMPWSMALPPYCKQTYSEVK